MPRFVINRILSLFLLANLCLPFSVEAYEPPLGIPAPPFGIDETAPPWPGGWPSTEVPGYYYIDNTHPDATDSGNPYGYPARPRLTIPETTYAAGSYVEIHGGPYTGGGQIIFTANGTADNPVWFRGADSSSMPTIRGETIVKGSYVILENLYYDTSNKTISLRSHNGSSLHHAAVRNCVFSGPGTDAGFTSAIVVSGSSASNRFSDIVIYKNKIHDFGDNTSPTENDYHGIGPSVNVDRVWILENEIYNMGGDSVQIGTASTADENRVAYVYVGGNTFHGDRENAVDIKEADNVIVSQNIMHDYSPSSSSAGGIVAIHFGADKVWVLNNTIYNGTYGIITTGSTDTYFIGNVVYDIRHPAGASWDPYSGYSDGAAIHFRGASTGGAINNTLYNYDTGIQLTQGTVNGYVILNNILSDRSEPEGMDIRLGDSSIGDATELDHNLFYNIYGAARIEWGGVVHDLSSFKSGVGKCLNCLNDAPAFSNSLARDFTLRSDSPARDGGVVSSVYDLFFQLYGLDIKRDVLGVARPQGSGWDIGAYEYELPPPMVSPDLLIN